MSLSNREAVTLALFEVPRWTRRQVAQALGIRFNQMSDLCLFYCRGRRLLSDFDVEVLRLRRRPGQKRPTPEELAAQVWAAGPGGILWRQQP